MILWKCANGTQASVAWKNEEGHIGPRKSGKHCDSDNDRLYDYDYYTYNICKQELLIEHSEQAVIADQPVGKAKTREIYFGPGFPNFKSLRSLIPDRGESCGGVPTSNISDGNKPVGFMAMAYVAYKGPQLAAISPGILRIKIGAHTLEMPLEPEESAGAIADRVVRLINNDLTLVGLGISAERSDTAGPDAGQFVLVGVAESDCQFTVVDRVGAPIGVLKSLEFPTLHLENSSGSLTLTWDNPGLHPFLLEGMRVGESDARWETVQAVRDAGELRIPPAQTGYGRLYRLRVGF